MVHTIRERIAAFNNIQTNSDVIEYINRPNIFSSIGKLRDEMTHSKMVAELLSQYDYVSSKEAPFVHFMDILLRRSLQQPKTSIAPELRDSILARSIPTITLVECSTELLLRKYNPDCNSDKRIDIYLKYELGDTLKASGGKTIELFIENKVGSKEHGDQTKDYFAACKNKKGEKGYKLFVYLTPVSSRDLDGFGSSIDKPACSEFIYINYQDILDYVIEPLLHDGALSIRDRFLLGEYVNCLELPLLDEDCSSSDLNIMATSAHEENLIRDFLSKEENKSLFDLIFNFKLGLSLYSYGGKEPLTFIQVMSSILKANADANPQNELNVLGQFDTVVARKNNGCPFLVYSPNEGESYVRTELVETEGMVFCSAGDAVIYAIQKYCEYKSIDNDSIIDMFKGVYQKKGEALLSVTEQKGYERIPGMELYIRQNISLGKCNEISAVLGTYIGKVTNRTFHRMLVEGIPNEFIVDLGQTKLKYTNVEGTNYYFRTDVENRISQLNNCLYDGTNIDTCLLNVDDIRLLNSFYKNHKALFLSVFKVMIENLQDGADYSNKNKKLKRLILNDNKVSVVLAEVTSIIKSYCAKNDIQMISGLDFSINDTYFYWKYSEDDRLAFFAGHVDPYIENVSFSIIKEHQEVNLELLNKKLNGYNLVVSSESHASEDGQGTLLYKANIVNSPRGGLNEPSNKGLIYRWKEVGPQEVEVSVMEDETSFHYEPEIVQIIQNDYKNLDEARRLLSKY